MPDSITIAATGALWAVTVAVVVHLCKVGLSFYGKWKVAEKTEGLKAWHAAIAEDVRVINRRQSYAFTKQYDNEFRIYLALWESAVEAYSAAMELRPTIDYTRPEVAGTEQQSRLKKWEECLAKTKRIVLINWPFYSKSVFDLAQALVTSCINEAVDAVVQNPRDDPRERFEQAEKNRKRIEVDAQKLGEAIRARLAAVEDLTK